MKSAAALHWAEIAVVVIAEATQETLEGSVEEPAVAIRLAGEELSAEEPAVATCLAVTWAAAAAAVNAFALAAILAAHLRLRKAGLGTKNSVHTGGTHSAAHTMVPHPDTQLMAHVVMHQGLT